MLGNKTTFDWQNAMCHDCGTKAGKLHELGCDMERCPVCGRQLITCSNHFPLVKDGIYTRIPYIQPLTYCGACAKVNPDFFMVPDEEWDRFVIPELQGKVICHFCYDEMKELFPDGWRNVG